MESENHPHFADLRRGRWSAEHKIYHVTAFALSRTPVFADLRSARSPVRILQEESEHGTCITLAYVVMPDHLHWLLQLLKGDLSSIVGRVKSLSARTTGAPVWQVGFHDHALRREEDLQSAARYIIANPVRAGLADRVGAYPHWDAIWF